MEKSVRVDQLKVGMYVFLNLSWFEHPFITNHFLIDSESQIQKILACGIKTVVIDTEKGNDIQAGNDPVDSHPQTVVLRAEKQEPDRPPANPYEVKMAQSDIYEKISEVVGSKKLQAGEKAKAVQHLSLVMMSNLLDQPTNENIRQAKANISKVVDVIVSDDATAKHLLQITSHDYQTYTHSVTVGLLAVGLSKILFRNSNGHNLHELGAGFFLHDIGKVKVDLAIINKPARLTNEEMDIIRKHPEYGCQVLKETDHLTEECKLIILQHHERFDGTGYPYQLKGVAISLYGRICSIADVYEALTADRPYKKPLKPIDALKLMKDEMMNHFHRPLFEKFALLLVDQ